MNPERNQPPAAFALLCQPAGFSRAVAKALRQRQCTPRMLLLPQYPPAAIATNRQLPLDTEYRPFSEFEDIEIVYAPRERQRDCAGLIAACIARVAIAAAAAGSLTWTIKPFSGDKRPQMPNGPPSGNLSSNSPGTLRRLRRQVRSTRES